VPGGAAVKEGVLRGVADFPRREVRFGLDVPVAPDVMVMNSALLLATQLQPVLVVTLTLPVPPDALMALELGEML